MNNEHRSGRLAEILVLVVITVLMLSGIHSLVTTPAKPVWHEPEWKVVSAWDGYGMETRVFDYFPVPGFWLPPRFLLFPRIVTGSWG